MDCLNDTQPMETQVWDDRGYQRYWKADHTRQHQQPHTYDEGDTGHVDLNLERAGHEQSNKSEQSVRLNARHPQEAEEEDEALNSEDELAIATQSCPEDITSPAMPTPITPAYALRLDRENNIPSFDDRLDPLDPADIFKDQNETPTLGLTQLFAQTQGTSSPAAAAITPGAIFERPSPRFDNLSSAVAQRPVSSPVRMVRSDAGLAGPRDAYISSKESQEMRRQRIEMQRQPPKPLLSHEDDDDCASMNNPARLPWPESSKKRRRAADFQKLQEELKSIVIPLHSSPAKRRKLRSRSYTAGGVTPTAQFRNATYISLLSEDTPLRHNAAGSLLVMEDSDEDLDIGCESKNFDSDSQRRAHKRPADCIHNRKKSGQQEKTSVQGALWSSQKNATRAMSRLHEQVPASQQERLSQHPSVQPRTTQSDRIADSQPDRLQPDLNEDSAPPYPFMPSSPNSRKAASDTQQLSSSERDRRAEAAPQVAATSSLPSGPPRMLVNREASSLPRPESACANRVTQMQRGALHATDELPELASSPPAIATLQSQDVPHLRPSLREHDKHGFSLSNQERTDELQQPKVSNETHRPKLGTGLFSPHTDDDSASDSADQVVLRPCIDQYGDADGRCAVSYTRAAANTSGFSTARTHLSVTPRKRKSESAINTTISQSPNIRKMTEFAPMSQVSLGSVDVQTGFLSKDDADFSELVAARSNTHGPLSQMSVDDRLPRDLSTAANTDVDQDQTQTQTPKTADASRDPPSVQADDTSSHSQRTLDMFEPASPTPQKVVSSRITRRLKGINRDKPVHRSIEHGNDTHKLTPANPGDAQHVAECASCQTPKGRPRSASSQMSSPLTDPPTSSGQGPSSCQPAAQPRASVKPRRVLARFSCQAGTHWYPATLVGVVADSSTQIRVRFDDGNVAVLHYWLACALDLRIGDEIKVDKAHMRNSNWVVRGLKACAQNTDLEASTTSDINGHDTLMVCKKQGSHTGSEPGQASVELYEVSVRELYLPPRHWANFQDRRFQSLSDVLCIVSRLQTPLQTDSEVVALSSRKRRQQAVLVQQNTTVGSRTTSIDPGILANMLFLLTFTAQNVAAKRRIKSLIQSQGGLVIEESFDRLFEIPQEQEDVASPANLRLKSAFENTGFTALIADGYSRKTKYIQALALNIPCLHHRWVSASIDRGETLPWQQYLLPAGESDMLDSAIRSRFVAVPDDAESLAHLVSLRDLVNRRPKLMDGQNTLIVTKNLDAERKNVYFFLAHAMGARKIKRVGDLASAKQTLKDDENWDWVCVDKDVLRDARRQLRMGGRAPGLHGRHHSAASHHGARVVGDEFIIQTLIFGALVDT